MILVNGVKYACSECIRGHRSTLCRHYMRALLRVRSKGRPNDQFPGGNKNYRVAVFATEVENMSLKEDEGCKTTPVIILKVSDKQVMDVTNGHIVGPYNEHDPKKLMVGADSFVNSTSCCSSGVSKPRKKKCACNHGEISKKSILTSYLNKKLALQQGSRSESNGSEVVKSEPQTEVPKGGCCGSKTSPQATECCSSKAPNYPSPFYAYDKHETDSAPSSMSDGFDSAPEQLSVSSTSIPQERVFQVIPVEPCSIPGTCSCSSDCTCASCVVHNNSTQRNTTYEFLNNDTQYSSNINLTSNPGALPDRPSFERPNLDNSSHLGNPSHLDSRSHFDARAMNGPRDMFNQLLSQYMGHQGMPPFLNELQKDFYKDSFIGTENATTSSCNCPDDSCSCYNCEQHGIIDGYNLDDYFQSVPHV